MKAKINLVFSIIGCVLMLALLPRCAPAPSSSSSIPSPDGSLILVTSVNQSKDDPITYLCVKFQIVDSAGNLLYEEQTRASDRMRWSMHWEDNQHIVLDSSDIGTRVWEQQANGSWQKMP